MRRKQRAHDHSDKGQTYTVKAEASSSQRCFGNLGTIYPTSGGVKLSLSRQYLDQTPIYSSFGSAIQTERYLELSQLDRYRPHPLVGAVLVSCLATGACDHQCLQRKTSLRTASDRSQPSVSPFTCRCRVVSFFRSKTMACSTDGTLQPFPAQNLDQNSNHGYL